MLKKYKIIWGNMAFRKKLAISYLLAMFVPIMVMGIFSFHISKKNLYRQAIQGFETYDEQLVKEVDNYFERYELNLNQIAVDYRIQSVMLTRASSDYALLTLVNGYFEPLIYNMSTLDNYVNQVLLYTNCGRYPSTLIKDVSLITEQPWYQNLGDEKTVKWHISNGAIYGARNIFELNSRGQKLGTICMEVDYQQLFHSFLYEQDYTQGILLKNPDGECTFIRKADGTANETVIDHLDTADHNEITVNGRKYLLIDYPLSATGYRIYFYMACDDLVIDTTNIFYTLVPVLLCCLLSTIIIMQLFSRSFTRPIEQLNTQMQEVSDGNFMIEAHSKYNDEIGQLTNRFASMIQKIRELITQVYQAEILKKDAQLETLQAQINPHFLYNAFSVINWKAIEIENDEISYFVRELAKFYRSALNSGQTLLPVSKVIENIRAYVNICLVMYNNSFETEYLIEESLNDIPMLNLLLQPVVENAIEHGVRKLRKRKGRIVIRAWEEAPYLFLEVEDNGVGMTQEQLQTILYVDRPGYALKNINERILIYYGDDCGISFESIPDEYTKVRLKLKKSVLHSKD